MESGFSGCIRCSRLDLCDRVSIMHNRHPRNNCRRGGAVERMGMADEFTFPIEAGKVREFAQAVFDEDNPIYWDADYARSKGLKAPIVPPTFVQAASFWRPQAAPGTSRDMRRVLHGEQEFDYLHPIYVGDMMTVSTAKVDEFHKSGRRGGTMTFTVNETTYTNQDGIVCVKVRSTTIETSQEVRDT